MDKNEFIEKYSNAPEKVDYEKALSVEKEKLDPESVYIGKPGTRNLIIVMEELAELQQQLSKYLRGKGDHLDLVEECADVLVGIGYIKAICGVTDAEINKAINVKVDRLQGTEGIYK